MINIELSRITLSSLLGTDRVVNFSSGLNVVTGPYGSGKSSLLELIKYGLGGSANLSEAVLDGLASVTLEARLGAAELTFERAISTEVSQIKVRGADGEVTELHPTSSTKAETTLASTFLLEALGVPVMRARSTQKVTTSSRKETISFWDIYRYIYVSQDNMGQSIAGHTDSNLNRKRKRAFELMFGLLDETLADLQNNETDATTLQRTEQKRLDDISSFLETGDVPSLKNLQESRRLVAAARSESAEKLEELRTTARASTERYDTERQRIAELRARAAELSDSKRRLQVEIDSRSQLLAQLELEIEHVERSGSASQILAQIDFHQCPRCMQRVSVERTTDESCYLCLQALDEESEPSLVSAPDEIERLQAVIVEVDDLRATDRRALEIVQDELAIVGEELSDAEVTLEEQTQTYVSPLFESISEHSRVVARSDSEDANLRQFIRQREQELRISGAVADAMSTLEEIQAQIRIEEARLDDRRSYVQEFSRLFDEIIEELELAWYATARVDLKTYMPMIGAGKYDPLSGGQKTVVSVAYHLALLTTGLVNSTELLIPSLLIMDTPSKYLGTEDSEQIARNYRRIAAIVEAYRGPLQLIVADNDMPPPSIRPSNVITLSYETPLVPDFEHPGGIVTPIFES